MVASSLFLGLLAAIPSLAADPQLGFNSYVEVENRTLDEIYQAGQFPLDFFAMALGSLEEKLSRKEVL